MRIPKVFLCESTHGKQRSGGQGGREKGDWEGWGNEVGWNCKGWQGRGGTGNKQSKQIEACPRNPFCRTSTDEFAHTRTQTHAKGHLESERNHSAEKAKAYCTHTPNQNTYIKTVGTSTRKHAEPENTKDTQSRK
jgi:hypothetical protein